MVMCYRFHRRHWLSFFDGFLFTAGSHIGAMKSILRRFPFFVVLAFVFFEGVISSSALASNNYSVSINGAPGELEPKLTLISKLKNPKRDFPTLLLLRRAAQSDRDAFLTALKSAGYYNPEVDVDIQEGTDGQKPTVSFVIRPGMKFKVSEYNILYRDDHPDRPASMKEAGLKPTTSAAGADLQTAQTQFLIHLLESGYPSARILGRRAIANFETGNATAVFEFESGPKAGFGTVTFNGAPRTNNDYLRRLVPWEDGAEFDRRELFALRRNLESTELFTSIDITNDDVTTEQTTPISVDLIARKPRTVGAGVSFSTVEGIGARLFFQHRNLFGRNERFSTRLRASELEQAIDISLIKPLPRVPGNAFTNFTFANQTTDAFDARTIGLNAGVAKRWLDDKLETQIGIGLETSNITTDGSEERTFLISTPLAVVWNSEDDVLNPVDGFRSSLVLTPYSGSDSFTQADFAIRDRVHFGKQRRFTLAGRAKLGATFGNSLQGLPANKRFFSGGGGSVRGFGFQEAGPLDADNNPIGGRSVAEIGVEFRSRITKNVQFATFYDVGTISSSSIPDFNDEIFMSYGTGVRYLSPIGPFRVDVAFPVDRRASDRRFQLYIALGQPF